MPSSQLKNVKYLKLEDTWYAFIQRYLVKEIEILRLLDHPNIIKLIEVYEDETHVHLVLEYLNGGELFEHISRVGTFLEADAINLIKCLLSALSYAHSLGIIHRDLKPENLIMANKSTHSAIKIADFGLATVMGYDKYETLQCGSPGYIGI
jgi:serine/threonine protein kinase